MGDKSQIVILVTVPSQIKVNLLQTSDVKFFNVELQVSCVWFVMINEGSMEVRIANAESRCSAQLSV